LPYHSPFARTNFAELFLGPTIGGKSMSIKACGEQNVMSNEWFARPVLFVADIDRSVDFYVKQLGFTQPWRYEEEGKARVAQVERQGCELILSSQWPDKVGKGLIFISLDAGVLDDLRAELEGRGVDAKDGQWGYRLMVVADPDGNELYFPYPTSPDAGSHHVEL
jgi:catechol 2,3-dioxygenase-like lactoylglutathione lyase family enzyme